MLPTFMSSVEMDGIYDLIVDVEIEQQYMYTADS